MSLRKIASLTMLLAFILLVATSVIIYIAPYGRQSSQWAWAGLGKHEWQAMHTNLGVLLLTSGIVHIVYNIKPIVAYLRNKQKKMRILTLNFNIALLLAIWVVSSTLYELPPINTIQEFRQSRKHIMDKPLKVPEMETKRFPDRPPFRFGSRSLEDVCEEYGLDQQAILQALENLGIKAKAAWSIKSIAEENDMEPHSIFDVIQQLQAE
jgi:hypothetical protein